MPNQKRRHTLSLSACLLVALLLSPGPAQALCNNPPVAIADQAELIGSLAIVDALANDTEPDGEAVEVQIVSGARRVFDPGIQEVRRVAKKPAR